MAYATTHHAPVSGGIAQFFTGLMQRIVQIAENQPKMRQIARLCAMSDEELAQHGLKREDIARHVFGSQMYI